MDFLREHQLNFMLFLSGICTILAILAFFTKSLEKKRRFSLVFMELCAALLLIADRYAYLYRGDPSQLGYWMVRISNFLVYFLSLLIIFFYNKYLLGLFTREGKLQNPPVRLQLVNTFFILGVILLVLSQFVGFYYTFDEMNRYQRGPGFIICYIAPFTSIFLQFSVILQYFKRISKNIGIPLVIIALLPIIATVIQIFTYGLSLTNMAIVAEAALLYIFVLLDMNRTVEKVNKIEIDMLKEEQQKMQILFEQTAEALANAIDAKDAYTHGHSTRVAEYARQIAINAGKTPRECGEIYFAGLLHDVGKIGIPISIINKTGRLTDEEFAEIKKHPVIGSQILSSITQSPYLSIAAKFHHERYDGRGYPYCLKGADIPDIARIIAVADAYDAMTSRRSYRDPIPQQRVREEIVKGIETQFDPVYAKIMLHLIDIDTEYTMKEHEEVRELAGKDVLVCEEYRKQYSEGIHISDEITKIHLHCKADKNFLSEKTIPSFIIFDSLDARIHDTEQKKKDMIYYEHGEVRFDGYTVCKEARKNKTEIVQLASISAEGLIQAYENGIDYDVEAVRYEDHVYIEIKSPYQIVKITIALQDSIRYAYLGLTGEHCFISNVDIKKSDELIDEDYIQRIEEKISYIDVPAGDVPNVQVNDWCSAATEGIVLKNELEISFHTMSLPTARLIWHCPFVSIFYSKDKKFKGEGYKEFAVLRLDGETWESYDYVSNRIIINKTDDFNGWDDWKQTNKQGMDCTVRLQRIGHTVKMETLNCGIAIRSTTTIKADVPEILIALTGDQVALTNIKINLS